MYTVMVEFGVHPALTRADAVHVDAKRSTMWRNA